MISIEQKKDLLSKPVWSYKDIMDYRECSKATAISIKKRAIKEKNGGVEYGDNLVKTDSVLALYGTSRQSELEILNNSIINNQKEGEQYARD